MKISQERRRPFAITNSRPTDPRKSGLQSSRSKKYKTLSAAFLQAHNDDLLETLRANRYQYGAGLMTEASRLFEKFGAVTIDNMLERHSKERFLSDGLLFLVVDGRHRRACIPKLARFGQLGTGCASQSIRMRRIRAPWSDVLLYNKLIKPSSSGNMLFGVVLRDRTVIAAIKLLIQYSRTIDSSYEVSFQEASVADTTRDLVSGLFVKDAFRSSCCCYIHLTKLMRRLPELL